MAESAATSLANPFSSDTSWLRRPNSNWAARHWLIKTGLPGVVPNCSRVFMAATVP